MEDFICLLTDRYGIVRSTSTIEAATLALAIGMARTHARQREFAGFELWQHEQRVYRGSVEDANSDVPG